MEDKAIQDLEDAGIYPVPDNDVFIWYKMASIGYE